MKNVCLKYTARKTASRRRPSYGVTLVELMVVIVILGLLAGLITPKVLTRVAEARVAACKTQIQYLHDAVNNYYLDILEYPLTLEDLVVEPSGVEGWIQGGYLDQTTEVPLDPWDNDFGYECPGNNSEFDIFSLGKDGQEGGEGEDEDIYNTNLR